MGQPLATLNQVIEQCLYWIEADQKVPALKTLQGKIWLNAYQSGVIKGHLYPDAIAFLKSQAAAGNLLYVYSSGSVQAQQLLFQYSEFGDVRYLFQGYFDTQIGHKQHTASYRAIK